MPKLNGVGKRKQHFKGFMEPSATDMRNVGIIQDMRSLLVQYVLRYSLAALAFQTLLQLELLFVLFRKNQHFE